MSINEFPKDYIYDNLKQKMMETNPMLAQSGVNIDNQMIENSIPNFNIKYYYVFNSMIVNVDNTDKLSETKADIENNIKSAIAVTDREASASYVTYNSMH